MGVQAQITRLEEAKAAIRAAIIEKGIDVPEEAMLDEMADYIVQIKASVAASAQSTFERVMLGQLMRM